VSQKTWQWQDNLNLSWSSNDLNWLEMNLSTHVLSHLTWEYLTWPKLTSLDLTWPEMTWVEFTWPQGIHLTWGDFTWPEFTSLDLKWSEMTSNDLALPDLYSFINLKWPKATSLDLNLPQLLIITLGALEIYWNVYCIRLWFIGKFCPWINANSLRF